MGSAPSEVVFSLGTPGGSDQPADHAVFRYANGSLNVPRPWKRGRPKGSLNKVTRSRRGFDDRLKQIPFEFVNISQQSKDINETSRAIIRKHVKLYQNRQKGCRLEPTINQQVEGEKINRKSSNIIYELNLRQIPGVDPFNKSPIQLEPYMHDLLVHFSTTAWKRLYSLEVLAGCNPMAEYWLPLAFHDCALIHCLIGCADVYVSGYTTIKDRSRGLRHLTNAISIVNQRFIEGKDMMSIGTLAVIAGIALLEKGAGRHDHWRTHMQGLKQLVDSYGGLESLHSEPMVLNKIYRADLYGSLDAAQSPYFDRPLPYPSGLSSGRSFHSIGFNVIHESISFDETLCTCLYHLEDAMLFWYDREVSSGNRQDRSDTNTTRRKNPTPAEAARVRYLLTDVQYTLVSMNSNCTSGDAPRDKVLDLFRITLILYSLTILNERPVSTAVGQRVTDTFRRSLTDSKHQSCEVGQDAATAVWLLLPADFYLWGIFLASSVAMTAYTDSDTKDWLLISFMELYSSCDGDIQDWHDLKSRLSRYLWVPSIHDSGLQRFWSEVAERRRGQAADAIRNVM